jgi:hypothetical protein
MKPTTETTIEMNKKQAAEQIARLIEMFNKKSSKNSRGDKRRLRQPHRKANKLRQTDRRVKINKQ